MFSTELTSRRWRTCASISRAYKRIVGRARIRHVVGGIRSGRRHYCKLLSFSFSHPFIPCAQTFTNTTIAIYRRISSRRHPRTYSAGYFASTRKRNLQRPLGRLGLSLSLSQTFEEGRQKNIGWYWQTVSASSKYQYRVLKCISIAMAPPFAGLRRFPQGRGFKQWTGDDSKALMKVS